MYRNEIPNSALWLFPQGRKGHRALCPIYTGQSLLINTHYVSLFGNKSYSPLRGCMTTTPILLITVASFQGGREELLLQSQRTGLLSINLVTQRSRVAPNSTTQALERKLSFLPVAPETLRCPHNISGVMLGPHILDSRSEPCKMATWRVSLLLSGTVGPPGTISIKACLECLTDLP